MKTGFFLFFHVTIHEILTIFGDSVKLSLLSVDAVGFCHYNVT